MESAEKQIFQNRKQLEKAVSGAQKALKTGRLNSVIAWAQIGAEFACFRHPGFYNSVTLESLLLEVADRLDTQKEARVVGERIHIRQPDTNKKRVLHVMTEAYGAGGHTRVVSGWIRNTSETAVHSVVTTAQQGPLPNDIASSIAATGGGYQSLAASSSNLLTRSFLLRQVSRSWADVVVLHAHPYDALPVVAFGVDDGPPVIFFNHADHRFWLGASVADVVADLRPLGQKITLSRRGVKNSKILPVPIIRTNPTSSPEIIRRQFDVKKDITVLLTIGDEYKYTPFAGYDFAGIMAKILRRNPNVVLFAVGPRQQGRWAKASALVGGRIRAMGVVDWADLHAVYACADIYVDGFPIGGTTALLEAGSQGIPIIGLHIPEAPHLNASDDIALEKFNTHAPSPEAFTASLENMITQSSLRNQKSAQIKESIELNHFSPGWNDFLDDIIRSLPSEHSAKLAISPNFPPDTADLFLAGFETAVLERARTPSENAKNSFGNSVIKHAGNLSNNEQLRSSLEMLSETNNVPTLKNSLHLLKKSLRAR